VRAPALVLMHALIWGRGSRTQPSRLGSLNRCGAGTSISTNLLQNQCLLNELRIGLRWSWCNSIRFNTQICALKDFSFTRLVSYRIYRNSSQSDSGESQHRSKHIQCGPAKNFIIGCGSQGFLVFFFIGGYGAFIYLMLR
jgi:hypothetical protein